VVADVPLPPGGSTNGGMPEPDACLIAQLRGRQRRGGRPLRLGVLSGGLPLPPLFERPPGDRGRSGPGDISAGMASPRPLPGSGAAPDLAPPDRPSAVSALPAPPAGCDLTGSVVRAVSAPGARLGGGSRAARAARPPARGAARSRHAALPGGLQQRRDRPGDGRLSQPGALSARRRPLSPGGGAGTGRPRLPERAFSPCASGSGFPWSR
jgi:hypothetical protein